MKVDYIITCNKNENNNEKYIIYHIYHRHGHRYIKYSMFCMFYTWALFEAQSIKTLTHSFPIHSFSTPRKQKKRFQGVEKGFIGSKWVKQHWGWVEKIYVAYKKNVWLKKYSWVAPHRTFYRNKSKCSQLFSEITALKKIQLARYQRKPIKGRLHPLVKKKFKLPRIVCTGFHPLLFVAKPPAPLLNLQTVQTHLFLQSPPLYWFFVNLPTPPPP